ncbi:hypothetical protein B9Z19DRAFT_1097456 [Tuber borchii]|uniref:Uncharacterized protein n=1 Tax=Tuber borchii TaxID=42251 RepID=A0A2T6ZA17_TUBBO|nr:hypothetical protein B9Z19DRAFT_1097456 [Tuber borchii]
MGELSILLPPPPPRVNGYPLGWLRFLHWQRAAIVAVRSTSYKTVITPSTMQRVSTFTHNDHSR